MSVPKLSTDPKDVEQFTAHLFSKREFQDTYMKALKEFYKKDDEGNDKKGKNIIKKGIKFLKVNFKNDDSKYGYDVMYEKIFKLSKTLSDSSLKSFISGLEKIQKILKSYIKNKTEEKNKTQYVEELSFRLGTAIDYLRGWLTLESVEDISNRDLAAYSKALILHTNFREIEDLVKRIAIKLSGGSNDSKQKIIKKSFEETINVKSISAKCYTKSQFKKFIVQPLAALCDVDDAGYKLPSGFKSDCYTKMVKTLKDQVNKFPDTSMVDKAGVRKVRDILQGYYGNKDSVSNKQRAVGVVLDARIATEEYIGQTQSVLNMTQKQWDNTITRDIVCYMQALVDNDSMKAFRVALNRAAIALTKKPESEVKKESGVSLMNKYK